MKYTAALIAFAAGALAQSSVTSAPATTSAPAVSLSPSISCVSACNAGDVTCQASCLGIARPNSSQAVETNECAAKCDQGDGSPDATQKFSDCVQGCIASLFPSSQTGSQIPGAAASSAAGSGTGASGTGASGTGASGSANPTASTGASGSSSTVSQTGSAAPQATGAANAISARIGGAGLAGLLAVFAL